LETVAIPDDILKSSDSKRIFFFFLCSAI
jgi:hypothetical protein